MKNQNDTFDRIDLAILALLQREGRLTNAELAERVNLSASACLRRVQRLEADGVINGYTARVAPSAVGLGLQAFVRIQLTSHGAAAVQTFVERVHGWDDVVACHALTGDMDYLLHVIVEDLEHFSRFLLDHLLNDAGVADVNSSFVLRTVKQERALPLRHLAGPPQRSHATVAARSRNRPHGTG
jgi:Lrp/AsnC family leucine-responsive transcriptional regulator